MKNDIYGSRRLVVDKPGCGYWEKSESIKRVILQLLLRAGVNVREQETLGGPEAGRVLQERDG